MHYYYAEADEQKGPFEKPDLAARGLRPDTLVWREGLPEWQPAGALPELTDVLAISRGNAAPVVAAAPLIAYGGYAPPAVLPTGLAVTSLVLGVASFPLLSFYCTGIPVAVMAVVFGHVARWNVRRNTGGGAGMALGGLICGYGSLGLALAGVAFLVVLFGSMSPY